MKWKYKAVDKSSAGEVWFTVGEVYFEHEGVVGWCDAIAGAESVPDLVQVLRRMADDIENDTSIIAEDCAQFGE